MSEWRNQIVFLAIAVAESVILYAILGVIGQALGMGGSPLPWSTIVLVYLIGMFTSWFVGGLKGGIQNIALAYGGIGLATVYLAVATFRFKPGFNFDFYWIYHVFDRQLSGEAVAAVFIALITAAIVWRRTSRIMRDDRDSADHLKRVFKFGLVILAVALVVDELVSEPAGYARLLVPYFVATLAGMAVARLPYDSPVAGRWAKIILVALGGFIGLGLIAGYAGGRFGSTGLNALFALWGWIVDGIIWVIRWPLTAIGWLLAMIIEWLRSLFNVEPPEPEAQQGVGERPEFPEREAREAVGSDWVEAVLEALQWPLTFLLLFVLLVILALAYRRIVRRLANDDGLERESIRDEVDDVSYLDLLKGLLPEWMTRRGRGRWLWRFPDVDGIREIFQLYFETLELAVERGMVFDPNRTPTERRDYLGIYLPGAPIEDITARFNKACYGNVLSEVEEVEALRERLLDAVDALDAGTVEAAPTPAGA